MKEIKRGYVLNSAISFLSILIAMGVLLSLILHITIEPIYLVLIFGVLLILNVANFSSYLTRCYVNLKTSKEGNPSNISIIIYSIINSVFILFLIYSLTLLYIAF